MAGLDAVETRVRIEQRVARVDRPSTLDVRTGLADDPPDDRAAHEDPCELGDVACARHVAWGVQPVGADEVRVPQPEPARLRVHHCHEAGLAPMPDVVRKRVGRVVRARDQRGLDQVANRNSLSLPQEDGRLADRGHCLGDGGDRVQARVLERDEHGHELGDARDRAPVLRVGGGQHLPGRPVLDDVGPTLDGRWPGQCRRGEDEGGSCGGDERL